MTNHENDPTQTAGMGPAGGGSFEHMPASIGGYRILSRIGAGGMGVVYEAEQLSPRRRVAVKVVRGGRFVDEQVVRMFQREVEILARLRHPNIGAIYESGRTQDGEHFFAMELVQGKTLDDHLKHRPPLGSQQERSYRLQLFRQIADAVHYAHQRGVIHRDLKPSNILVADAAESRSSSSSASESNVPLPQTKVLDFGLARITDSDVAAPTMMTEMGAIRGTLQYMSPEQARGDTQAIDLRSDVYALGVILYEMLSGARPYEIGSRPLPDAIRIICEQPPRPLQLETGKARRTDPDLGIIVGKALAKDGEARYASAAALSEDIGRYLTAQPILARPPSAIYTLRKFTARNKVLVGGVVATLMTLVVGVIVATTFGLSEAAQRREAVRARSELKEVVDFQSQMLRSVDPQKLGGSIIEDLNLRVAEAGRQDGVPEGHLREELLLLGSAMERVNPVDLALSAIDAGILRPAGEAIGARFSGQPLVEAQIRQSLGDTYSQLGLYVQAEEQLLQARAIFRDQLGESDKVTLSSGIALASLLERRGNLQESEQVGREVYEISQRVQGEDDEFTLGALNRLAIVFDRQLRFEDAERYYRMFYEGMQRTQGADSLHTVWGLHNLGSLYRRMGQPERGAPLLRQAVQEFRRLVGDKHRGTVWALQSLAFAELAQGRLAEAEDAALAGLQGRVELLGDDHPETVEVVALLARIRTAQGQLVEAETLARDALKRQRRSLGSDSLETLYTMESLAEILVTTGRKAEAIELYAEILERRRRVQGENHRETTMAAASLAALGDAGTVH